MKPLHVSDHSIVRYLERCYGMNIAAVEAEILSIVQPYHDAGAIYAPIGGMWAAIKNNTVVTIRQTKPGDESKMKHDTGGANKTHLRGKPLHWKAKQRHRNHR